TVRLNKVTDIFAIRAMDLNITGTADKTNHIIARNGVTAVGIAVFYIRNFIINDQRLFIAYRAGRFNIGFLHLIISNRGMVSTFLLFNASFARKLLCSLK